jgi:uncharacterized membrane protein YoaK (UPF0700 family)
LRLFARDIRLLVLAASAGSADGWSYFGLGHAFVANMTGNTVLLGLAVFQNHGDMLHPGIALACYAVGVMLGSILTKGVSPGAFWSKAISRTLLIEGLVLLASEAGWVAVSLHSRYAPGLNWLLATVAMAVGAQSGAMVQLKIPGIVTTYITGTWTTLLSGLVHFKKDEEPKIKQEYEHGLAMQAGVLGSYFLAAVLSGWLFRHLPVAVGAVPALAMLLVSASSDGES